MYCEGDVIYHQDVNILAVNSFRHPYLRHKGSHCQTKTLTITIVCDNDSRIFPRNVMACFTHVLSQSWLRNPRIAFRPIGKHMLYTLYHAVIARKYIWVKQNVSFAHV